MNEFIAYCGLDCEKCEARIATMNNDDALRQKVAKEWSVMNEVASCEKAAMVLGNNMEARENLGISGSFS